jgi:hypothetical protein
MIRIMACRQVSDAYDKKTVGKRSFHMENRCDYLQRTRKKNVARPKNEAVPSTGVEPVTFRYHCTRLECVELFYLHKSLTL